MQAGRRDLPRGIDSGALLDLFPDVSRFRPLLALVLVALWLPATLHCEIEATGLLDAIACCESESHPDSAAADCSTDSCEIAEGAFAAPAATALGAAPVLCVLAEVFPNTPPDKAVAAPPLSGVIVAAAAPPEINRSWSFAARAAPLPGAPASVLR